MRVLVDTFNKEKALVGAFCGYCENFANNRWQLQCSVAICRCATMAALLLLLALAASARGLGVEVEDVTGKQLEAALQTEDTLAVMFCE